MKYIIDIPNSDVSRWVGITPLGKKLYVPISVEDGNEYNIGTGIYVEEYTEPDRKVIEDEVWKFAKKVRLKEFFDDNHNLHPYLDYFDSYQDAKAKHEELKKSENEIRVGDEVEIAGTIGIVTRVPYLDEERVHYIAKSGTAYCNNSYAEIKKTGRHFDEVEELFKKMGDE